MLHARCYVPVPLIRLKAIACYDAVHSMTFVKTYIVAQNLKEGSQKKFVCNYDQLKSLTALTFVYVIISSLADQNECFICL